MRLPVTGMAWTTPLGNDLDQVWERLLKGETGIASVPHTVRLRSSLAASVDSVPSTLPPGERMQVLAKTALDAALASARVTPGDPQVRLVVGTSLGSYLEEKSQRKSLYDWAKELGRSSGITSPL